MLTDRDCEKITQKVYATTPGGIDDLIRAGYDKALEWSPDDVRDDFSPIEDALHPLKTKRFELHDRAMALVGNRRSKGALVDCVNALLSQLATLIDERDRISGLHADAMRLVNAAEAESAEVIDWLDNQTTFYEIPDWVVVGPTAVKVAETAKNRRIWYHSTNDLKSFPFSAMMRAAIAKETK